MTDDRDKTSLEKTKTSIEKITKDIYKKEFDKDAAQAIILVVVLFILIFMFK